MAKMVDTSALWKCETCFHHRTGECSPAIWCEDGEAYRPDYNKLVFIEAEPVVYCKYCIRWQKDKTYNIGYCDIIDGHTNPKNFCCWGEESPFRKK